MLRPIALVVTALIFLSVASTWRKAVLTNDNIDAAVEQAREKIRNRPDHIAEKERLGYERVLIYKTLVLTGLRKGELASIILRQVHLDVPMPYLELHGADEKNREGSQIPLRPDLADDLRTWIAGLQHESRPDSDEPEDPALIPMNYTLPSNFLSGETPLFYVPRGLLRILERDLKAAGIPKRDERGRTIDVHALRHSFGTLLSKGGVPPRTAQATMRHSTINMTMSVYTDPKLLDIHGALDTLLRLPLDAEPRREEQQKRRTGTDSSAGSLAPKADETGQSESSAGKLADCADECDSTTPVDTSAEIVIRKGPLSIADNGRLKSGRLALV